MVVDLLLCVQDGLVNQLDERVRNFLVEVSLNVVIHLEIEVTKFVDLRGDLDVCVHLDIVHEECRRADPSKVSLDWNYIKKVNFEGCLHLVEVKDCCIKGELDV